MSIVLNDIRLIETTDDVNVRSHQRSLSTVPEWMKINIDTMMNQIDEIMHTEEEEDNFTFLVRLSSGVYLYADHYLGSGSYDCCRSLQVIFSSSWELIRHHLKFKNAVSSTRIM